MNNIVSRRSFLASTLAAGVMPALIPSASLGADGATAPSERINMAVLGLGDRGNQLIGPILGRSDIQLVSVCDAHMSKVNTHVDRVRQHSLGSGCTGHQDYREIMARDDVDAVVIATPEHWHGVMAVDAMKAGKDVYCEKALTLTVPEGRAVCNATRRYGRILQAGLQQRSDRNFRHACELARAGFLGKLKEVKVSAPGGYRKLELPLAAIPSDLNYDIWLGPSPYVPHRRGVSSYNWYFLRDYCAGWIQSWGVHHLDIALWGAPELMESTLEAEGTASYEPDGDADVAFGWDLRMQTPSGLKLLYGEDRTAPFRHGCHFVGDEGWVHVHRDGIHASRASLLSASIPPGPHKLQVSRSHIGNFVESIKTRRDPIATAESCHAATALSLVADIASRVGRKVVWDWKRELFVDDEPASRMLARHMREPWTI